MFHVIGYLVLGGLSGWIAGHFMSGHAFGWWADVAVGLVGGLIGGVVFSNVFGTLHFAGVGEALAAILFACALVSLLHIARPQGLERAQS